MVFHFWLVKLWLIVGAANFAEADFVDFGTGVGEWGGDMQQQPVGVGEAAALLQTGPKNAAVYGDVAAGEELEGGIEESILEAHQ